MPCIRKPENPGVNMALYRLDLPTKGLDLLVPVDASAAKVTEKDIEMALSGRPECIVRTSKDESPLLIIKTSVAYQRMADIIALDSEGRLVLIECKRGWAPRQALAQLLDYASEYDPDPLPRLVDDWRTGQGRNDSRSLIKAFQEFADDPDAKEESLGREHVLVVVAAGRDDAFERISHYLQKHGVPVHMVKVQILQRKGNGELFLEVEPIDLTDGETEPPATGHTVWMINTDETHCPGSTKHFLEKGVAAIWAYQDGPATLSKGAKAGDAIYAYQNGVGIIARGQLQDDNVRKATDENRVFPSHDGNEWNLAVKWTNLKRPISNSEIRKIAGAGLPVRNTFSRLHNPKVRELLEKRSNGEQ
jgi:hypothetical protein